MAKPRRCPYCNQILPEFRLGVRLPDFKARIFDLVLRGGEDGIATEDLLAIMYDGHRVRWKRDARKDGKRALYNHIVQINAVIRRAGYRIVNSAGSYRLHNLRD